MLFLLTALFTEYFIQNLISTKIEDLYTELNSKGIIINMDNVNKDSKELSRNIQRFADDSNIKIKLLEQKENFRREFIGNLAHELKTPLFIVQGYILSILDGLANNEKSRNKFLKKASNGIERLESIINDLDTITKIESGISSIEKEKFNIRELIINLIDLLEIQASNKNITIVLDEIKNEINEVFCDKEAISQVLTNLIVNSLKYGVKNGTTEIIIEDISDDKILIRIIDNGKGISENDIKRIFERFYRVEKTRNRNEGGSGLGLAIVKHIIDAHGEKIYVESTEELGSEFSFTLQKNK
tara:strand:- start:2104 stop:3003 length:900 start_codon:yes stop_codon:yes gene_type:complete